MQQQAFLQMDDGLEHQEQLYLLEVLVDNISIEESKVPSYLLEPYGPLIVKAKFLDFPDLEFDQGKCSLGQDDEELTLAGKIIAGAPESWQIEIAKDVPEFDKYPQYRVIIPISKSLPQEPGRDDAIRILVPQSAVITGEGLRYINAVVKTELDPTTLEQIHQQVEEEASRRAAQSTDKISEFTFAAGKSLLFPMTPYKLITSLRKSPLYLQVTRSGMYANDKPFFTLIGQVKLLLGDSFVKAIMVAGDTKVLPVSAHIEDQYPISNVFGDQTGKISVFLRLSCFGKSAFENEAQDLLEAPADHPQGSSKQKFHPLYSDYEQQLASEIRAQEEKFTKPVPWRKPWDDMPEYEKPPPALPPFYEPLPPLPPPPPPPKPFDIGEHLPNLPRCGPNQPPPCYRRAGDAPLSYCTRDMEAQLRREEMTKYTQTDSELQIKNPVSQPPQERYEKLEKEMNKKNLSKLGAHSQGVDQCKMNVGDCECDGAHCKRKWRNLQGQSLNRFDGSPNKEEDEEEEEDQSTKLKNVNTGSRKQAGKKCTCPRIPDILLPPLVGKPQCGCRCGAIKAKIAQQNKNFTLVKEKITSEGPSNEDLGSNKERSEKFQKPEESKSSPQTSNSLLEKEKRYIETSYPKRNDVFFLPGADSSTHIALTSQECGYDLKRYLQRAEEMGEFEQVRKYIDPNPLSGLKPNKLPDEVKKALEKEVKKLEEKTPALVDTTDMKSAVSKSEKDKKDDGPKDVDKKPTVKNDGGKVPDEKVVTVIKPAVTKKDQKVKAKIRASNIYEYTAGMYPGIHVGHKYCVRPLRLVPKTMGWLWNVSDLGGVLKPGRGWRPGAVRRNVNNLLKEWRSTNKGNRDNKTEQELDMLMMSTKTKRTRPTTPKSSGSKKDPEHMKLNPTIHLHKKDRFYYVSMYPVKTESQEEMGEEPQPIQFKIDRKHPDGRPEGNEPCFSSTDTSSDSSSYEVEYIAPAAMKQKRRKVDKTHMFSQYDEDDFMPKKIQKKGQKPCEEQPEAVKKQDEKDKKGKKGGKKGKKGKGKKKK
ncbi:uncharacterized protein Ppi1 [Halyomorpha halys]|uniref:uncharacterized protein Ppi1 n=1 Tax=Halyomorpha halys TaxID=286706 RepID=UPI0006D4D332|nr:uncharacterized protein LOC106690910 [Halyomorpha halys]